MSGVTYDSGQLIALERGGRDAWLVHDAAIRAGSVPTVPAPVLTEVWRGASRQAQLARALAGCRVESLDEVLARRAGVALGVAGSAEAIDAIVAASAASRDDVVVTSDSRDFDRLRSAFPDLRARSV
jgi:predicted nucleic acid-binding protein